MAHKENGTMGTKRVHVYESLDLNKELALKLTKSDLAMVPMEPNLEAWQKVQRKDKEKKLNNCYHTWLHKFLLLFKFLAIHINQEMLLLNIISNYKM